jgi:hypothetical protein
MRKLSGILHIIIVIVRRYEVRRRRRGGRRREGQHEAEGILAVQVEAMEAFLGYEAEGSIESESWRVIEFRL